MKFEHVPNLLIELAHLDGILPGRRKRKAQQEEDDDNDDNDDDNHGHDQGDSLFFMTWIRNKFFVAVVTLILFLCSASYGSAFSGNCIRVTDGDTIVVLTGSYKIKVRLYGVDCPETDQRYGAIVQST
jgi:hypothetical protein